MVVRSSPRVAWIPKSSGLVLLSLFTASLAVTSPLSRADTDLVQHGGITLDPNDPGPVVLEWLGRAYDNPTGPAPGLTLSYHDDTTANGIFRLFRSSGQYQWQLSTATGDPRLAMTLGNDHSLTLVDPLNNTQTIAIRPGASGVGGVFMNGVRLLSATEISQSYLERNPARLAVGTGATVGLALGSAAIGRNSSVTGNDSLAVGNGTSVEASDSIGIGSFTWVESTASNSVAIGSHSTVTTSSSAVLGSYSAASGQSSLALGNAVTAVGNYSTALGYTSYAGGDYSIAMAGGFSGDQYGIGIFGAAYGYKSLAIGDASAELQNSIAIGSSAYSGGRDSTALGPNTTTILPFQVAVGSFNDPGTWTPTETMTPNDFLFMVGNGHQGIPSGYIGSNALSVTRSGNTRVQGNITVEGGTVAAPVTSVFQRDVHVQGVLRVPAAGDISMGAFQSGTNPVPQP